MTAPLNRAAFDIPTKVRPEALLRRAGRAPSRAGVTAKLARSTFNRLLSRLRTEQLTIIDRDGSKTTYRGERRLDDDNVDPVDATRSDGLEWLEAELTVHDDRAWSAVLAEGSIGLGRGYIEGWWTSDDPVTLLRVITRNLRGLDELRNRWEWATGGITNRIHQLMPGPGRAKNREDISSHYDLGNDFFALFLDETMTYSAAVFEHPAAGLATASLSKYDRLLAKLGVSANTSVLEIGTGWGGMAIRAAQTAGCHVTSTTISEQQRHEAQRRVDAAGLDQQVSILGRDWRDLEGRYDRVVSIEMIEAVHWRDYERFFAAVSRRLKPTGLVGLQAICVPDRRYERTKKTEDFIRRYVFPGGNLPSIGAITAAVARATRMQIVDVEDFSSHYAETLAQWRHRFDTCLAEIHQLGLDDRFCRLWRFYLAYCEAGFRERHCTVNQFVLAGPDWRPNGLSLRPC